MWIPLQRREARSSGKEALPLTPSITTHPSVGFSSIGFKDSVRNAEQTGDFCWNLVTRPLSEAMNANCAAVGPEVDEFSLSGLTPAPSRVISVPHVAESPVKLECRVSQVLQLTGTNGDKVDTWMVFGEVVGVHISRNLLRKGIYDTAAANLYFAVAARRTISVWMPQRSSRCIVLNPKGGYITTAKF